MISAAEARTISVMQSTYINEIDKVIRQAASRGVYHIKWYVHVSFVDAVCKVLEELDYNVRVTECNIVNHNGIIICWHPDCDWE